MKYTGFQEFCDDQYYTTGSASPSDYKSSQSHEAWNPSNIINSYTTSRFLTDENIENSREPKHGIVDSLLRASTGQHSGFYEGKNFMQQSASDLLVARIKDEASDNLPKLSEMINSPTEAVNEQHSLISVNETTHSFFPGRHLIRKDHSAAQKHIDGRISLSKGYNFGGASSSSISTTLDLPNSSLVSCSLGLNSQMLDLQTIYGTGSSCFRLSYDHTFGLNEESMRLGHSNMQGQQNSPSNSSNKISSLGFARTKTPTNCSQPKAKKLKSSCPPLKVRKEKLGDRIQTLQRLVAPFGKTDTASVLTEAIGYIHFLHDQIQTLSVPYIYSSQSQPSRIMQLESRKEDGRKSKADLRSRGICLVPISYASFINPCI